MSGPLKGIKVLDLSRVLAGPWAGQLLGDLGAEVIKVEKPGSGDDTRSWGPPWLHDSEGNRVDAAYYHAANRGKKSLCIDMADPEGREILSELAQHADILIENFKVGGLRKYGLDYETLKERNPGLIYCSVTGFGQDGPYAPRPGYDFLIQAMGGLMSITGEPDEVPGARPEKVGVAISDLMTGMYGVVGILSALHHRNTTGEGQHIDMSLLDSTVAMLANQNMNYLIGDQVPTRLGNAHPNIVPYQDFKTKDGYLILSIGNRGQWERFCDAADIPGVKDDPRFETNESRVMHRKEVADGIAPAMLTRTTAEWIQTLEAVNVPCGPINNIAEAFADPQVRHRGMRLDLPHESAGTAPSVATPIKMSDTPLEYDAAPPVLGQHTDEILIEMGKSPEKIEEMRKAGVIG